MDKYEFNIKAEQIKKQVNKGDFETAMKIADTIDWKRVRNVNLLSLVSTVYEKNGEYQEAKDILIMALERAPIGKRLLYKLTQLALKQGEVQEAESYYREFCELSSDDSRQDVLRYLILKAKGAPMEQLIHSLESYTSSDLDEKWLYELAELYHQAGMEEECVKTCDKIMLMFGLGKYVDKAMELKLQYAPLTKYQMDLVENRDKYEAKLKEIEENGVSGLNSSQEEYEDGERAFSREETERAAARREQLITMEANYEETNLQTEDWNQQDIYKQSFQGADAVVQPQNYVPESAAVPSQKYTQKTAALQPQNYVQESIAVPPQQYTQENKAVQPQSYVSENVALQPQNPPQTYGQLKAVPVPTPVSEFSSNQGANVPLAGQENKKADNRVSSVVPEPVNEVSVDEKLAVSMKEAEVEASLAEEMSKISIGNYTEEPVQEKTRILQNVRDLNKEEVTEKTKILDEIRHIQPLKSADEQSFVQQNIPKKTVSSQTVSLQKTKAFYHIMLESRSPEKGLEMAVEVLKKAHQILENRHSVAKISGEKLNQRGIFASSSMLTGKDLIVENAGDLSDAMLEELSQLLEKDNSQMMVILVDNPRQMEGICKVIPSLAKKFFLTSSVEEARNYIERVAQKEKSRTVSAGNRESQASDKIIQRPVRTRNETAAVETAAVRQETRASQVRQQPIVRIHQQDESVNETLQTRQQADFSAGAAMIRQKMNTSGTLSARQTAASPSSAQKMPSRVNEEKKAKELVLPVQNGKKEAKEKQVMDIDEFAQYCCHYASQIDCNISGKSMLALYERIEIMEEDGIKLTPEAAEDLIEEAADRAEKPSIGKRLTGIFSSKYDKEGLLILREEHFI